MGAWLFACYEMQATPTLVIMAMAYITVQFCLMNMSHTGHVVNTVHTVIFC